MSEWKYGDAVDFLGLTPEDGEAIDLRIANERIAELEAENRQLKSKLKNREGAVLSARTSEDLLYAEVERLRTANDEADKILADGVAELQREFDIVDSACDFWKQTAIELGYEE